MKKIWYNKYVIKKRRDNYENYKQRNRNKRNFTIRESITDFENWVDYIVKNCISQLEEEYNNEDEEEVDYEPL